ncbi:Beta-glucuronidase [Aquisphaera giovannonii]|uniref:Beta-glucuronidase n=1 Tax=Aquisphaera giovannonii TaxID=406548 RepID=A0A5B9W7S4_9BACT|nr:sugar-binding domain-containing protein [Aquisphaera giovannonii]QEH36736.1 Beta-glucuronidase [Aquisphaera giovannonii]
MRRIIPIAIALLLAADAGPARAQWQPAKGRLETRWTAGVRPENAWKEYPRPQLVREEWESLNGLWDYAIRPRAESQPASWDGKILVPFCAESALSGVMKEVGPDRSLWYHRTFSIPEGWAGRHVLLHFGAVDWEATVTVNGKAAGSHRGGYDPFSINITPFLKAGENTLVVRVWDPTDAGFQPRGKQVRKPEGIWYTAVTGIWQTAWMEPVAEDHIRGLRIVPHLDRSAFTVTVHGAEEGAVRIEARDGDRLVGQAEGRTGRGVAVPIVEPKPWSPSSPHLYDLTVTLLRDGKVVDRVASYAGLRKIEVRRDSQDVLRLFLNNEPLFQYGPLDQGWWPDGLYTAPTDEALKYDIEVTKQLGFNMARKHVKVEPDRWYYWCDKLGLLVWQDMPSGDSGPEWIRDVDRESPELRRSAESALNYDAELSELVVDLGNHPSIVAWVPFNEAWGQFDTPAAVERIRRLDNTRPVNAASGGNFQGVGDILDVHSYPDPAMPRLDKFMAVVCGEFGGLGLPVENHTWLEKGNWGYRSYKTPQELTSAYVEKVNLLRPLIAKGLAAAVYTQTTDVEVEVNGLMTYDRKVIKMDRSAVAEANQKLYPIAAEAARK